jgi:hypothetical protein
VLFIFNFNVLMHSSLVSFIVLSLVLCLFLMLDVFNPFNHYCLSYMACKHPYFTHSSDKRGDNISVSQI